MPKKKKEFTEAELKALPGKVRKAIKAGKLTAEEENVLRMRYGLAEADDGPIESRGQDFDLTRRRLAQMEDDTLDRMRGGGRRLRTTDPQRAHSMGLPWHGDDAK